MDKPTLQEVKEYFKNAKDVRSADFTNQKVDLSKINDFDQRQIHEWGNSYWICHKDIMNIKLWCYRSKQYAEIISYKEPLYKLTSKEVVHAYENPQWLKDTFKECFETELEVNRWYKHKCGGYLFVTETNEEFLFAYGFKSDMSWFDKDDYLITTTELLQPATEKEVEEALVKEAIKIGFKSGVVCNNSNIHKTKVNDSVLEYHYIKFKDNELRIHENDCKWYKIFSNGTWAEITPVPTYTIHEAESKFNIKIKAV